jgi:hypothetical protein
MSLICVGETEMGGVKGEYIASDSGVREPGGRRWIGCPLTN